MTVPDLPPAELLGLLLQQTRDHALILLSAEGRVSHWLGAARHVFGYEPGEIVGRPVDCLFTPEDCARDVPAHELQVALQDGRAEDDRWHVRKDGLRIWTSGSTLALRDAQGGLLHFAKLVRDRTDQRAHVEMLGNRIRALAAESAERRIALATLSHELRNALTPLFNALYLMRIEAAAEPIARPLATFERQLPALRRLADDLDAAARPGPGAGRLQLRLERLDLIDVLQGVAAGMRPDFDAHRLTLHLLVPAGPLLVEMDAERIRQALSNLLGNAVRYTPPGGRVWLKATVEGEDAVVRVEDSGIGIAPDMLPGIFELFTRAPSAEALAPEGRGIGLALVKEIATLHGGGVAVRSEGPGRGSEFSLRLPLSEPGTAVPPVAVR